MELPQLFGLLSDWPSPTDPREALEGRRALWRGLTSAESEMADAFLFPAAKGGRRAYVTGTAPHLADELALVGETDLAPDLGTLLSILGQETHSGMEIGGREQFEALALFDLSLILLGLEIHDPDRKVLRDQFEIVELLKRWMRPWDTKLFVSHHDPKDQYRVRGIDALELRSEYKKRPRLFARENPLPLRATVRDSIPFIFHQRPKDRFLTALKIWKQISEGAKKDPFTVIDRRAFRFVAQTLPEALLLIEAFTYFMEREGGRVEKKGENRLLTEGSLRNPENGFSSPWYKDVKFTVTWRGTPFEVQFTTLEYAFNARYSLGPENHELYRLSQALKFYLPGLYPASVYQTIDKGWEDENLRKLLERQTTQRLGWVLAK